MASLLQIEYADNIVSKGRWQKRRKPLAGKIVKRGLAVPLPLVFAHLQQKSGQIGVRLELGAINKSLLVHIFTDVRRTPPSISAHSQPAYNQRPSQ